MRNPTAVLITGGAGFIGSALIRWLLAGDRFAGRVVNLDALTYAGNLANLESVADDPRYVFVHGNICDRELVGRVCREHSVDCVVNLAAESHVDRSIHGPEEFLQTNVMGVLSLLEVAREMGGIHFHQVSTDEVYGSLGAEGRFVETTAYDPRSPYSASKAAADHLVRSYGHTYGLPVTISNCCNNYGPYQFPEKLIPLMIANALAGEALPVYGDGGQVRDWLYVDDHAEALWEVVTRGRVGESYNVGAEAEMRNVELVELLLDLIAERTGRDRGELGALVRFVEDRPGHDRRYAIDPGKIQGELGWRARVDFAAGLGRTVDWYLGNGEWIANVRSGAYREWVRVNYGGRRG